PKLAQSTCHSSARNVRRTRNASRGKGRSAFTLSRTWRTESVQPRSRSMCHSRVARSRGYFSSASRAKPTKGSKRLGRDAGRDPVHDQRRNRFLRAPLEESRKLDPTL